MKQHHQEMLGLHQQSSTLTYSTPETAETQTYERE